MAVADRTASVESGPKVGGFELEWRAVVNIHLTYHPAGGSQVDRSGWFRLLPSVEPRCRVGRARCNSHGFARANETALPLDIDRRILRGHGPAYKTLWLPSALLRPLLGAFFHVPEILSLLSSNVVESVRAQLHVETKLSDN